MKIKAAPRLPKLYLWLLPVIFLLLSLGQLQRVFIFGQAIYLHEMFMMSMIVGSLWVLEWSSFFSSSVKQLQNLGQFKWWMALLLLYSFRVVFSTLVTSDVLPLLYLGRSFLYASFAILISRIVRFDQRISLTVTHCVWISSGLVLVFGLLQFFIFPDMRQLKLLGWDDHYYRLISTLLDPGITGLVIIYFIILNFFAYQKKVWPFQQSKYALVMLAGSTTLATTATALTFSRASYLALALSTGLLFVMNRRALGTRINAILIVTIVVFFSTLGLFKLGFGQVGGEGVLLTRVSTVWARYENTMTTAGQLSWSEWLWGKGLYSPLSEKLVVSSHFQDRSYLPDNWLVTFIFYLGLPLSILGVVTLFKYLAKIRLEKPYFFIFAITTVCQGLFLATVFHPFTWILGSCLWIVDGESQ